ncbi:MAG: tRNA (adenosine(37)-N6)-threonylcarbamoyltransferase complex dimerization subunit type 1 TsaB [Pseudomonadota bacterium]
MRTLAVDTAAHLCAACIYDSTQGRVASRAVEDIGRGHAERLFAVIDRALDEASLTFGDLDRLGVCIGPGSFTGVRVGVSAMRGLSLALSIPVVGVSQFDALAKDAQTGEPLLVVLDARRGEVYAQAFDKDGEAEGAPAVLSVEAACASVQRSGAILVGSGAPLLTAAGARSTIGSDASTSDIATIAQIAARADLPTEKPKPMYLRSADAKPQSGFAVERLGGQV